MNINAMMKQVQKIQKEMETEKQKLDEEIFEVEKSMITLKMKGNKELVSAKINVEEINNDDIEILEDMLLISINDLINKINKEEQDRLGKYTKGLPGIF